MLKKIRVALALVFWLGITLLLLDFTGTLHSYLGWIARVQLLPAILALNVGVVVGLAVLTLLFGRVYCSVICPLGVLQDGISRLGTWGKKRPYQYKPERKWIRYGVWAAFVVCLVAGVHVIVSLLAPYSAYGRMVTSLLQPVYLWGNNLLAWFAERAGSYTFYSKEVWLRSVSSLVIAAVTLVVIVLFALKHGRAYCNTICPVGTTLGFLSRFAMFRPMIDADRCVRCHSCERQCKALCIEITPERVHIDHSRCVSCFDCLDNCPLGGLKYRFAWGPGANKASCAPGTAKNTAPGANTGSGAPGMPQSGRRAFLSGATVAVGAAALKGVTSRAQGAVKLDGGLADVLPKQAPEREVPLTPPGSAGVKDFYRHCTACQLCIAECPNNVLRPSGKLERLMQPEMGFEKGFCRPECTRCSELCPAGAIKKISREEKTQYHIGTARVNPDLCLVASGKGHCNKCVQACPSGAVKYVKAEDGRRMPVIAEEICTGCGACEYLCPVRPVSAITVNGKYEHL